MKSKGWAFVHIYTEVNCAALLAAMLIDLFSNGNLTLSGHGPETISTLESIWMLSVLASAFASGARGIFNEVRDEN